MTEFQTRCPCSICRKVRANRKTITAELKHWQPAGHTGVDYAQPPPALLWQLADTGYMFPTAPRSAGAAATWNLWEAETPIFHDAVIAHNIRNQDQRMEELK